MTRTLSILGMIGCVAVAAGLAGEKSGTTQSTRLYTEPDATVAGGIRAVIVSTPTKPVRHVFATGADDPSRCYKGAVDNDGQTVTFRGLPPAKYDLVVVFDDAIAEGFTLSRADDTLTDADRRSIEDAIMKSVPFFDTKQVHRCRGMTGPAGKAACLVAASGAVDAVIRGDPEAVLGALIDRLARTGSIEGDGFAGEGRVVANCAVGVDNVDVAAATARNVVGTNTPDVLTEATAESRGA